ncbi:Conserved hypothetical protein [Prochlorococcus marinus str. MIT 9313]|uniref:Uncharacterized protein n=1 Tax=Prochlorococcus marinus (strain MIT 9313) TaxID=74547 RepID=B9ES61_PROMM|nr:hypothetical protein [Prochlorococcus marinus]CAX32199.1 Conserved hypothetical protein [Prochlorococcus marinus str. MIT 9313]
MPERFCQGWVIWRPVVMLQSPRQGESGDSIAPSSEITTLIFAIKAVPSI